MDTIFTKTPNEWMRLGSWIETSYGKIFTNTIGNVFESKKTILFLHGFPTSSYDFLPLINLLSDEYAYICFDFLGLGFSDKPTNIQYSVNMQTDILEAVLMHFKVRNFTIVTHDYGVTIAQEFLARYKQKFQEYDSKYNLNKVMFLNGGLFPESHRARLIQKLMKSSIGFIISKFFGFKQFTKSFSSVFGKDSQPTEYELKTHWEIIQFNNGNRMIHKLLHYIEERKLNRDRWVDVIVNPPKPILLVNGSADPISGKHMIERFKELTGRTDSVELPGIGHYPQLEDVQAIKNAIQEFV
ncbi:alpha/beta fold hydrolase [Leptospira sp. GIMC2001]|uniref:alpha/beta fold hydrolase n=1 Tax=Leptospira sp. GIMC2001 TaxID=1513297 RepID=UPI00234A1B41|nr:alpha/beta hydrolase [Leptospira sp. GIMC2001]WCL49646.1 alpha/beta hydrolase [Leptospira sp. GIMC2001]